MAKTAVIIVTHNSARELDLCLDALDRQSSPPAAVRIVDAGSEDRRYLAGVKDIRGTDILYLENIGFASANNTGYSKLPPGMDHVLFLNPDTLLMPDSIRQAEKFLRDNERAGAVTGRLQGYDFAGRRPTGLLDSTGIFRKWYGRWYDRGQGEPDRGQYGQAEKVPAACGAFLFCRRVALEQVILPGRAVFDPDFFMYKEDIELCLRLRKSGWGAHYLPGIKAWHGRGWRERRAVPRGLRLAAARSEVILYRKHPSVYMAWALAKLFLVRVCRV